jgi:hypothetical protein
MCLPGKTPSAPSVNLIKPVHEKPYFTWEPDWSLIQKHSTDNCDQASREKLLERCQALEIALNRVRRQIRTHDAVIGASRATAAILELQAQKLRSALHMKEQGQKRKKKTTISLNVGDSTVITEDEFIKRVEAKKEAREEKKREQEGRKRAREKKHLLRNVQKEAWEEVCSWYEVEKAEYKRLCQKLRDEGRKVHNLPSRPKRCLQKEVLKGVRQKWERDVAADEDLMAVDEDASKYEDNCEVEASFFCEEDGQESSGWGGSSVEEEEEEEEGNADENLMDVDKP